MSRRSSRGDDRIDVSEERTASISYPADYAHRNVGKFLRDRVELYRRIIFAPYPLFVTNKKRNFSFPSAVADSTLAFMKRRVS